MRGFIADSAELPIETILLFARKEAHGGRHHGIGAYPLGEKVVEEAVDVWSVGGCERRCRREGKPVASSHALNNSTVGQASSLSLEFLHFRIKSSCAE